MIVFMCVNDFTVIITCRVSLILEQSVYIGFRQKYISSTTFYHCLKLHRGIL